MQVPKAGVPVVLLTFLSVASIAGSLRGQEPAPTDPATTAAFAVTDTSIVEALQRANDNRAEIEKALHGTPEAQRNGMRFLIAYMPDRDLQSLSSEYLLENVALAYRAREATPWGRTIPQDVFFNDVLPYASVNERRDPWRKGFLERFLPLVQNCQTPGEAAQQLNRDIFKDLDVKYHASKRPKPDQSPYESIEAKYASCSGLSILLIDACRAVCVPARFAGIPMWPNKRGNHSWVEIWDQSRWHFTGACEYNSKGLDKGWFQGDAAQAKKDEPEHAIYASSWYRTGVAFPLVWDRSIDYVPAVNVTEHYTSSSKPSPEKKENAGTQAIAQLKSYLATDRAQRPALAEQAFASSPLTRGESETAARMLWLDHAEDIRQSRAEEMSKKEIRIGERTMRFDYRLFGEPPESGRSLFLSMHGGGGAPTEVNDKQWENQKKLYEPKEGVYLAPRAPTDTWNLWHQAHIDLFFDRLIENLVVFENVNPNRVYIMGYSAGGDGVYQLAPRLADRWAAAAMMAGHPNETSPLGLRNIGFTLHVGELDSPYNRNKVAAEWKEKLAALHEQDPQGYIHEVVIHPGKAHWMDKEDAVAVPWMAKFTRDPFPQRIVWKQDDVTVARFYWLAVDKKQIKDRPLVRADRDGQNIELQSEAVNSIAVLLHDQIIDLDKPIRIRFNGETRFEGSVSRTIGALTQSLAERSDPQVIFPARVMVTSAKETEKTAAEK